VLEVIKAKGSTRVFAHKRLRRDGTKKKKLLIESSNIDTYDIQPCASRGSPTQAAIKDNSSSVDGSPHTSPTKQVGGLIDILILDS
jgi:hypothetical protein